MINQSQDSGSDEIRRLMQDEVIARIPLLLKYTSSAGLRLQVPETDIQIIAGPQSWIASQIGDAATNSCAQRGDKSDDLIQIVDDLLSSAQMDYEWGGSEDENGTLQNGYVDWKELRKDVHTAVAANLASQSQAAQPSIEELARYDLMAGSMVTKSLGDYVRFSDVAAHLAGQSQATRAAIEHAARICESFCACDNGEDDEEINRMLRNRATQIRGLLATPTAQEVTQQAAKAETAEQANVLPPTRGTESLLNADELAALRRFDECAQDGEGYDVPKEMMQRLAEIGVVRRKSGAYFEHTEYGLAVLDGTHQMDIGALVNSFLGWPLPDSLHDDLGRIEKPIGTHLMNADEARAMFEFVLASRGRAQGGETNTKTSERAPQAATTASAAVIASVAATLERSGHTPGEASKLAAEGYANSAADRAEIASTAPVQAAQPALPATDLYMLRRVIECAEKLDERPRPMCRDCADENGTCPNSGLECDMPALIASAKGIYNRLAAPGAAQTTDAREDPFTDEDGMQTHPTDN